MNILIALIVGVLAFFIAHLVFNEPISMLIGILAGIATFLGDGWYRGRRI